MVGRVMALVESAAGMRKHRPWVALAVSAALTLLLLVVVLIVVDRTSNSDMVSGTATFGEVSLDAENVTLGRYLLRRGTSISPYDARQLDERGRIIHFQLRTTGLDGQRCALRWTMTQGEANAPVAENRWDLSEVSGWPDGVFFPTAQDEQLQGEIWVPLQVGAGPFIVTLELLDATGGRLADTFVELSLVRPTVIVRADEDDQQMGTPGAG